MVSYEFSVGQRSFAKLLKGDSLKLPVLSALDVDAL